MRFGKQLKYLRMNKGMTQKELGLALGYNNNSADVRIAQYESGVRTPQKPIFHEIAAILDVPVELLDISPIKNPTQLLLTLLYYDEMLANNRIAEQLQSCLDKQKEVRSQKITMTDYCEWRTAFVHQLLNQNGVI